MTLNDPDSRITQDGEIYLRILLLFNSLGKFYFKLIIVYFATVSLLQYVVITVIVNLLCNLYTWKLIIEDTFL